jgi:hypothetical protein
VYCEIENIHALNKEEIVVSARQWVETVVINLNLCPFAKKVYLHQGVRFAVSDARSEEDLLVHLHDELKLIEQDESISTSLLIHPLVLGNFLDYNQFLAYTDDLLEEMNLIGVFQIASFHPQYQFADTQAEDVENFTNRSPYPMLHIINEEDLEKAITSYPDIHEVPLRNKQLMRDMGPDKMNALLRACLGKH